MMVCNYFKYSQGYDRGAVHCNVMDVNNGLYDQGEWDMQLAIEHEVVQSSGI
jgi:hypothetical protein